MRNLAEFVCRRGDLYPTRKGRQVDAEQGIKAQHEAQKKRCAIDEDYQAEVSQELGFSCAGDIRKLRGRMDGLLVTQELVVIEEFKCCGALPDVPDPVDQGQATIYAGMYAQLNPNCPTLEVRLVYIHADTGEEQAFTQRLSPDIALISLCFILTCYARRIERHLHRASERHLWAQALSFPMPQYRPTQKAIARRVFQAITTGENLLLEAPTGSGKSLAILFPALKAQQVEDQLFFLTSRNAGAQAALTVAKQVDANRQHLNVVEITAKEKACLSPDTPCDASLCQYAQGYFDRAPAAVDEALKSKLADRSTLAQVAQQHRVCPFELSLDTALWADLIIGDYNYIFDPVVRLQRFNGHKQLHLLIDEAHQLSPRTRDMLAVEINRQMTRQAKQVPHPLIVKRAQSVDRALMKIRRLQGDGESQITDLAALQRTCAKLLETVAEQDLDLAAYPELVDLYFAASRWSRSDAWYNEDEFVHIVTVTGTQVSVQRICLDPASYLNTVFDEHGATVRFSGTVSPLPLYQRLHGQSEAPAERAQSPFEADQTLVMVVQDIPTYYQARQASLPRVAELITDICQAHPGRYMMALPSYAYLNAVAAALEDTNVPVFLQSPGQSNQDTQDLIEAFGACEQGLLGIVMGGVLGESVDFAEAQLSGVIMIGLGLPPPSLARNLMQQYFEECQGQGWGRMVAYTQPALVKNIQAAGRLIRAQEDFGVICLIDPRFSSTEVQRFFPSHWQPQIRSAKTVKQTVENFFHHKMSP